MQRFAAIEQHEKLDQFVHACRERGLSVTHQRLAIYGALAGSVAHPSAENVYAHVRRDYPTISLATVYKTLETLERIGLIHKMNALHEAARYDANLDAHHHLICTECHQVFDYYDEDLANVPVPATALDGAFEVRGFQVQLYGVCATCRTAA